jgi:hypothetical protein
MAVWYGFSIDEAHFSAITLLTRSLALEGLLQLE